MRFATLLVLLLAVSAPIDAQDKLPKALVQDVRDLNLTAENLDSIEVILAKDRDAIATATAEIALRKAQLAKVLLADKPDRADIRRLVKESLDYEGTVRLAQIDRQVALRALLGEKGWKALNKAIKTYRDWRRDQPKGTSAGADKPLMRTIDLLDELAP